VSVCKRLQELCPRVDRDELYKEVLHAKLDLASLSLEDVMRRDAKDFDFGQVRVGVPAVPMPLGSLVKRHGEAALVQHFEEYAAKRGLHLLVVMTIYSEESAPGSPLQRELLLYLPKTHRGGQHSRTFSNLREFLERSDLQLEHQKIGAPSLESNASYAAIYKQKNVASSRKQVQPLLASFFAQHKL
jgi:exopolyphosphatase